LNTYDVVEMGISCHHESNDAVICYPKLELEPQHVSWCWWLCSYGQEFSQ